MIWYWRAWQQGKLRRFLRWKWNRLWAWRWETPEYKQWLEEEHKEAAALFPAQEADDETTNKVGPITKSVV
jgi:hypothetical protein